MELRFTGFAEDTQKAFFYAISDPDAPEVADYKDYDLCSNRGKDACLRAPGSEAYDWGRSLTLESAYDLQQSDPMDLVA